jgi:hypothetical protein
MDAIGSLGIEASLQGSLQALSESVELHRHRANRAEKRLRYIRELCSGRWYIDSVPTWRVLDILNGAADNEVESK